MKIFDTLQNLISGLGGPKDKGSANVFVLNEITPDTLLAMYRGDWIARKLVDIPAKDITKSWRVWKAESSIVELIEAAEKHPRINLAANICLTRQHARLLGGAIMYFSLKRQNPNTPLDLEKVRKDDLQYVRVFGRTEIGEEGYRDDLADEWYGHPEYYTVSSRDGAPVQIHPSRVVRFLGMPRLDLGAHTFWHGDSVLQVAYTAVVNASSAQEHIAGLIPEAKTDVMYIPGLGELLSTPAGTSAITTRFQFAAMMKSMFNMVLLDGVGAETAEGESVGESWEQKQIRFTDLPDLLMQYLQVVSGSADIPLTRFLQQSAAGLNATGEGELRNYYDGLAGDQKNEVTPALAAFDEVLIRSATGSRDASIWYEWAPLWMPTPEQQSKSFQEKATGAKALWETGLIPAPALSEALVNTFIEDGSLPGLEKAIATHGDFKSLSEEEQQTGRHTAPEPTEALPAPGATRVAQPRLTGPGSATDAARGILGRVAAVGLDAALTEFQQAWAAVKKQGA